MAEGSIVGDALKGATDLAKEIPVYKDALQPVAQGFGGAIRPAGQIIGETISGSVKMVLSPIRGLVWGWEKIETIVFTEIGKRFERKLERLVEPDLTIAGPVLESLRFTGNNQALREMYINLLATAMDSETASKAHPGFAEIIKQLTSDEAKLIQFIYLAGTIDLSGKEEELYLRLRELLAEPAKCVCPDLIEPYLGNLDRLGLILNLRTSIRQVTKRGEETKRESSRIVTFKLGLLHYGRLFCQACLLPDAKSVPT